MKLTLDGAQTIVSLNLEEARETAKYDHRTSEYWPTLIGERLWFLNMLNNIETELKHAYVIVDEDGNMECSNCGSSNCFDNYCGNCGAKLVGTRKDGEENG
jgi:hypothetical protein